MAPFLPIFNILGINIRYFLLSTLDEKFLPKKMAFVTSAITSMIMCQVSEGKMQSIVGM